ncbi:TetR/AcrR family transcriptional regulator [Pedobacter sp. AW31-3R]|uniref:TetR/AcrR family transcriptional regulator n=1 Tax=Pedobacter sp. AW31-3R TaxID=3445781 RepID=UPI003FA07BEF
MKNRVETEQKIIKAVEYIAYVHGFMALGINKVAKQAGVSKVLIYRYFGSFQLLLVHCMNKKKLNPSSEHLPLLVNCGSLSLKEMLGNLIDYQFDHFFNCCEKEVQLLNGATSKKGIAPGFFGNFLYREESGLETRLSNDERIYYRIVSKLICAGTNQLMMQIPVQGQALQHSRGEQREQLLRSITHILQRSYCV